MKEIVVFAEEPSIKPVLEELATKIDLGDALLRVVTHNGVSDLERSLPRKLRAWRNPNSAFLVLRDNDSGDCASRKARLQKFVDDAGRTDCSVIRIICQELEAWFLGDRQAMHDAGILKLEANLSSLRGDPDLLVKPSKILDDHLNGYMKISGAEAIAPHMCPDRNLSASFQSTVDALRRLAKG